MIISLLFFFFCEITPARPPPLHTPRPRLPPRLLPRDRVRERVQNQPQGTYTIHSATARCSSRLRALAGLRGKQNALRPIFLLRVRHRDVDGRRF